VLFSTSCASAASALAVIFCIAPYYSSLSRNALPTFITAGYNGFALARVWRIVFAILGIWLKKMTQLLFVYGTLRRNAARSQHASLLQNADFVGYASCQGRLYQVDYYPGVVPSADPADQVLGELYRLTDAAQTLVQLDHYEACSTEFPAPQEYRRELQPVELQDGKTVAAWVYVYNRDTSGLKQILSGDFLSGYIKR
jgi:gamma-glutamylcyclotransferase (GGCT)/AIG2-like uncharacterized protein YtfP